MRPVAYCPCGGDPVPVQLDRRHFLQIAGIAGLVASLPFKACAQNRRYRFTSGGGAPAQLVALD